MIRRLEDPGGSSQDELGTSVAAADLSGDGVDDILAGAPGEDTVASNAGAVVVFNGATGAVIDTFTNPGVSSFSSLGRVVVAVPDVSGDGVPDALAGSPDDDTVAQNAGSAVLFSGSDGTVLHQFTDPAVAASDSFGSAVAFLGDVLARSRSIEVVDRPAELATDTATVDAAARHAVAMWESLHGQSVDAVVLLYGNIPVRGPTSD